MSMTVFVTLVIWSCSLYWLENKKLEKNDIERAERASQNCCTFASEKCFTYRPETREKAINDFFFVSETCDSSQYHCVGESHSLSVQCVLMFVTLVIWSCSWRFIPTRTFQKFEKNPLMVVSEPKFFALLRQKHMFYLYRPENQKLKKKLYMIASKPFCVCVCVWNMRFFSICCWWIT